MKVNINKQCKVRLTAYGKNVLSKYYNKYNIPFKEQDEYEFQLWDLMNIFGGCFIFGSHDVPFEENVIVLRD